MQHPTGNLTDSQIESVLADLRTRAGGADADHDSITSAIADLECEAARRGLALPAPCEPTPPVLAFRHFTESLSRGDYRNAGRFLIELDPAGAWLAFRRACELTDYHARVYLLERLLCALDLHTLGEEKARRRIDQLRRSPLNNADFDFYLQQCITAHFNVAMIHWIRPF
ncbi:MAG TPA: hypothetical protein VK936_02555 [Longimicrobiales bacterium]|nr:hypothetical protein [Longimicrobiales bacterium]